MAKLTKGKKINKKKVGAKIPKKSNPSKKNEKKKKPLISIRLRRKGEKRPTVKETAKLLFVDPFKVSAREAGADEFFAPALRVAKKVKGGLERIGRKIGKKVVERKLKKLKKKTGKSKK